MQPGIELLVLFPLLLQLRILFFEGVYCGQELLFGSFAHIHPQVPDSHRLRVGFCRLFPHTFHAAVYLTPEVFNDLSLYQECKLTERFHDQ